MIKLDFLKKLYSLFPRQIIFVTSVIILSGICEIIALLFLGPVFGFITSNLSSSSRLNLFFLGLLKQLHLSPSFEFAIVFYGALSVIIAFSQHKKLILSTVLREKIIFHFRTTLTHLITHTSWETIKTLPSHQLYTACISSCDRTGYLAYDWIFFLSSLFMAILYLGMALYISGPMGLVLLLFLGLPGIFILRRYQSVKKKGHDNSYFHGKMSESTSEYLKALKSVKSTCSEAQELGHLHQLYQRAYRNNLTFYEQQSKNQFLTTALMMGEAIVFFLFAIHWLHIGMDRLVTLLLVLFRFYPKLSDLPNKLSGIIFFTPFYEDVENISQICEAHQEKTSRDSLRPQLEKGITLCNISYQYPKSPTPVFKELGLHIPPTGISLLLGNSGIGKSTLADMISGLISPALGEIKAGGQSLDATNLSLWREQVIYLYQEGFCFFSKTLRHNLFWPHAANQEERLWELVRHLEMEKVVQRLPQGLDTVIKNGGDIFSGGQKQRLALIWALLKQPRLLILDEATHALDAHNTGLVMNLLSAHKAHLSILIITHQTQWLDIADKVFYFDDLVPQNSQKN